MQLVNSGRLSLSTPVSQYIPEFENLVVIEDVPPIPDLIAQTKAGTPPEPKPTLKYHAAKEVMRIEHLMHHTSGLFYPFDVLPDWDKEQDTPYAGPHDPKDPVGAFLRAIKVSFIQFVYALLLKRLFRAAYLQPLSSSNQEPIVSPLAIMQSPG
jgi:CubicO group peptidase (beta-lactamase class C family)